MRMIFVNLPVKDLSASRAFWSALGFGFNEEYSDDTAACLVVDDNIFVMLITQPRFKDFINGAIADPFAATAVLNALSTKDRGEVDELVAKALAAGAKPWRPVMEEGPMYGHSFQDVDGHVWELVHMESGA